MKPTIATRIVLMLLLLPSLAFAHGGGLDAYGGHNNRKQGRYHFHRGPLAGNHYASKSEALNALSSDDGKKSNVAPSSHPKKTKKPKK